MRLIKCWNPIIGQSEVEAAALESADVMRQLDGQKILEVIYVPGKILNIRTDLAS